MKQFLALVQVKKIIALLLTAGFLYMVVTKQVGAQEYIPIYTLILGYYYGQSTVRQTLND